MASIASWSVKVKMEGVKRLQTNASRAATPLSAERRSSPVEPLRPAPILEHDDPDAPSLFTAQAMLSVARQQKGLTACSVPQVCVLDPDGDLERYLQLRGELREDDSWGCFHTRLSVHESRDRPFGIIGRAVGAAFSVLLAEQLFASGCRFLISISSAGQVVDLGPPPYFVVIDRALRDEGTSYHYLPPTRFADADARLLERVLPSLIETGVPLHVGASWTTDAPFRETEAKVARRRAEGLLTVEMEAAGLYAFAAAQNKPVLCLAQVTNCLNCAPSDFSKGVAEGAEAALQLIAAAGASWEGASAFEDQTPSRLAVSRSL
jgi:uridine phosphorylase